MLVDLLPVSEVHGLSVAEEGCILIFINLPIIRVHIEIKRTQFYQKSRLIFCFRRISFSPE